MSLKPVLDALDKIAGTRAAKQKKKYIEQSLDIPYFKEVVMNAYDSRKAFNINKFPKKASKLIKKSDDDAIFDMLHMLSEKKGASNAEISKLHNLCEDDATCEVVGRIVNKDLRCGVNLRTWKIYYPSLFEHNPMLCEFAVRYLRKYDTFSKELDTFINLCGGWENVIGSIKANGVRVWIDTVPARPSYISRSGKLYENFHILNKDSITLAKELQRRYNLEEMPTLDGEVTFEGEDFQDQMRQVRRIKDMDPSKFRLVLFDCPSLPFDQAERSYILTEMIEELHKEGVLTKTSFTEEVVFDDFDDFKKYFLDVVFKRKLEGLVLKKSDENYEFRRSKFWCKVKDWFSADLKVIGVEEGTGKYEGMLGALIVDFNGVSVRVGSGYSDTQRVSFFRDPPVIVEVEYKTVTKDGSMQHPSFVKEREDLIGTM